MEGYTGIDFSAYNESKILRHKRVLSNKRFTFCWWLPSCAGSSDLSLPPWDIGTRVQTQSNKRTTRNSFKHKV